MTTSRRVVPVKSVADVVAEYAAHADSQSAAPDGQPAGSRTVGLLQRRDVEPIYFYRTGKESNRYEEVERGEIRDLEEVQEILERPGATAWETVYLPLLKRPSAGEVARETGIAESLIIRYRKGFVRPSKRQMNRLVSCLRARFS